MTYFTNKILFAYIIKDNRKPQTSDKKDFIYGSLFYLISCLGIINNVHSDCFCNVRVSQQSEGHQAVPQNDISKKLKYGHVMCK